MGVELTNCVVGSDRFTHRASAAEGPKFTLCNLNQWPIQFIGVVVDDKVVDVVFVVFVVMICCCCFYCPFPPTKVYFIQPFGLERQLLALN